MHDGRLKLIKLIPVLDFGGVETVFETQNQLIDRDRFDLRVCTFWKAGAAAERIASTGTPIDVLGVDPSIRNPKATLALARYLRKTKPDILQASISEANFHTALVAKPCGVPIVMIEEHGLPDRPLPYRLVHTALYRMVDAIVGVSNVTCRYVVDREYAPASRVHLLYNAIAPEFFAPVAPRVRSGGEFRFVTVGRLHPMKNQERLIRAFAAVAQARPEARLQVVGAGPLERALARLVEQLGLQGRVELTGYRADVRNLVENADCFAFPSLAEAFGLAAVEAMARRVPVIASSWGALPEVVGELGHRWIVDPLDIDGWSRAMIEMISLSAAQREALESKAREIAMRFSLERHSAELHRLYDMLIQAQGLRPRRPSVSVA
jgi:glycosyltransferase involved in cell wall biosynthesis